MCESSFGFIVSQSLALTASLLFFMNFLPSLNMLLANEGQGGNRLATSHTTMSKYSKVFTEPGDTQ
jgi:hypothetical protein